MLDEIAEVVKRDPSQLLNPKSDFRINYTSSVPGRTNIRNERCVVFVRRNLN